jgi:short chain dehydrogenase
MPWSLTLDEEAMRTLLPKDRAEVVVITGASAGVGRAVVRAFAARGARIGLLARDEDGLDAARREVEALGGHAIALPTDMADPAAIEAAAEIVERKFGPIDVWVNDAMGGLLTCEGDAPRGVPARDRGDVPRLRVRDARGAPADAQPVPPIFQPEVAAEAVVWAAHHDRREIYVGSSTVEAILGNRIAPRLLDQYLAEKGYSAQQTDEPEIAGRPDNLLGSRGNGCFRISPKDPAPRVTRRYREGTLVLETEFTTAEGSARLVDCMPLRGRAPDVVRSSAP